MARHRAPAGAAGVVGSIVDRDWVEEALCRTVGCTGLLAWWFMWPHRYICNPFTFWRYRREQRNASTQSP
jgi:hypothetical protein